MAEEKKVTLDVEGVGSIVQVRQPSPEETYTAEDGTEKTRPAKCGLWELDTKQLQAYYEKNGIPDAAKVFKKIAEADANLQTKLGVALGQEVVKTKAQQEVHCGNARFRRVDVGVIPKRESRNLHTGEPVVKYGIVYAKVYAPNPVENDEFKKIADDIEKAMQKKFSLKS